MLTSGRQSDRRASIVVLCALVVLVLIVAAIWACATTSTSATVTPVSDSSTRGQSAMSIPETTETATISDAPQATAPATVLAPTVTATTNAVTSSTAGMPGPSSTTRTPQKSGQPIKNYTKLPTTDKVVALTFDGGGDTTALEGILKALKDARATGTFFLTGEFVKNFPAAVAEIVAGGYPIGNHSYSHPYLTKLTNDQIRTEVREASESIMATGAPDPRPLFRAPYGALDPRVLSVLADEGYVSIYWTIDTADWQTDRTVAQIQAAVLDRLTPGAIVLMHVLGKQTAQALPAILEEIKARGYSFVTLREAIPQP